MPDQKFLSVKDWIDHISKQPNATDIWKDFQSIFPPEDAQWVVFERCSFEELLRMIINKISLVDFKLFNKLDETTLDYVVMLDSMFVAIIITAVKSEHLGSDRFPQCCEDFCHAHGIYHNEARNALKKSILDLATKEAVNENIN